MAKHSDPRDILYGDHTRQQAVARPLEPWERPIRERGGGIIYRNESLVLDPSGNTPGLPCVYYTNEPTPNFNYPTDSQFLHRRNGPALDVRERMYDDERHIDCVSRLRQWYCNGTLHRLDGPAQLVTTPGGVFHAEAWYQHGKAHRPDGAAQLDTYRYAPDELVKRQEMWFQHDKMHRADGPAVITVLGNGLEIRDYWIDGKHYPARREHVPA